MDLEDYIKICEDELKSLRIYKSKVRNKDLIKEKEKSIKHNLRQLTSQLFEITYIFKDSLLISPIQAELLGNWINQPFHTYLLYRGSRDGFSIDEFNDRCTEMGPTLMIIKSKEGQKLFGGYTSKKWSIPNGSWINKQDHDAFVFSLSYETKHPICRDYDNAITMFKSGSRIGAFAFGGKGNSKYDLIIANKFNESAVNWSNLGHNYQALPGQTVENASEYIAGTHKFTVQEIEVYQINNDQYSYVE